MASSTSLVGTVLDGKYRVSRLLGRGGMGEVYAGTHLQLERPVAIKVLHGDLVADDSFVQRFQREARTAARLEHPNAVHVYDFGAIAEGSAYIVMEFIEGVTLREVMRRNRHFPLAAVLDLMRQACGAVGAAHARGIVHRDLKPENMMVRADETGRPVLKVVDFGLAKILENQTSQLTNKSELIGTPKYMAPEQFSGDRIDERVDVYALGCIVFELLAGRTPYEGTFIEVVGKHVYAEPPAFATLGVTVPPEVEAVVRRALAKDPTARTPSAAELARDLERAIGPDPSALVAEQITVPLPKTIPGLEAGALSDLATNADARLDPLATRATDAFGSEPDLRTRYADRDEVDEATRLRGGDPPTVVVPKDVPELDPHTRALRPARPTVLDLDPVVPQPPARPSWPALVAAGLAGAVLVGGGAYWLARPAADTPAPATQQLVVPPPPVPEAGTKPETVPEPEAKSEAAAEPAPKPAPRPGRQPATRGAGANAAPEAPETPEPPTAAEVPPPPDMGPNVPPAERVRRLKRWAREVERQRLQREAEQQRQRRLRRRYQQP